MALFTAPERAFAQTISRLAYCNPFLPERMALEKETLGEEFVEGDSVWSKRTDSRPHDSVNIERIVGLVEEMVVRLRDRMAKGAGRPGDAEKDLYEDLALFLLFHRYHSDFRKSKPGKKTAPGEKESESFFEPDRRVSIYEKFERDCQFFFSLRGMRDLAPKDTAHLFACFFQIRRAFYYIFECIIGESMPAARLRAAIWHSIFTHDMPRYRRALYNRMADVSTLVTGPSGAGKELVARAIGLSRYIPFDPESRAFTENYAESFFPLNLSALSPTLIESELFGHRRGAFTGALQDRAGWFEVCPPLGTVFLDEIGEVETTIQVKLLRVLESRVFQRLGDTRERPFRGKIIAATNRDLHEEMRAGGFRRDLYYRLCSDIIVAPSLEEQLRDSESFLPSLARFVAARLAGEEEADALAEEIMAWIDENLEANYSWPGNFRELEQCARNIMIRKDYRPARARPRDAGEKLANELREGTLTAEELLSRYCAMVYRQTGNFQETARRLELDHRTVKSKIKKEERAAG